MTTGGDAAEQVVRLSLEGVEVALRITGEGAKHVAVLLAAALKEEHKTKGKARLTSMIRSGKELKVFSVQNKDLKKFSAEAKRYGVLYCALKDRDNKSDYATIDIIARADDASKIQRIIERFELAVVDRNTITRAAQRNINRENENEKIKKSKEDLLLDEILSTSGKGETDTSNPYYAKTEKSPLSERNYGKENQSAEGTVRRQQKPSVRKKLQGYAEKAGNGRNLEKNAPDKGRKTIPALRKQRNTGRER